MRKQFVLTNVAILLAATSCSTPVEPEGQVYLTATVSQKDVDYANLARDQIILRIKVQNTTGDKISIPAQPCGDVYMLEQDLTAPAPRRLVPFKFCEGNTVAAFTLAGSDSVIFVRNLSEILPKTELGAGDLSVKPVLKVKNGRTVKGPAIIMKVL